MTSKSLIGVVCNSFLFAISGLLCCFSAKYAVLSTLFYQENTQLLFPSHLGPIIRCKFSLRPSATQSVPSNRRHHFLSLRLSLSLSFPFFLEHNIAIPHWEYFKSIVRPVVQLSLKGFADWSVRLTFSTKKGQVMHEHWKRKTGFEMQRASSRLEKRHGLSI